MVAGNSKTLMLVYQAARSNIPQYRHLGIYSRENPYLHTLGLHGCFENVLDYIRLRTPNNGLGLEFGTKTHFQIIR